MPELPEVETVVRDLDRLVRGGVFGETEVLRPDMLEGVEPDRISLLLRDRRIERVTRRAKNIVFELVPDRLVVNLGMTGRLLVGQPGEADPPYLGVRFRLADGREIRFTDVRRFGNVRHFNEPAWTARERQWGLEPLSPSFTPEWLHQSTAGSRVAIKTWLMDQRRVVGVGNIYASEALFRARLDPRRPAHSLSPTEAGRLHGAVQGVLSEAIQFRGTTFLDYRDAEGNPGGFVARLRVYDRAGAPCLACETPIERIVQGGRSSFFCPRCQR